MSGSALPSPSSPRQDVLGELVHSLSQPLTSLRCSLELSIDQFAQSERESVCAALEQTERLIHVVRLMQEYLETEKTKPASQAVQLTPVLEDVLSQFSEIAEVKQVRLRLVGGRQGQIPVTQHRLRMALQYLIGVVLDDMHPKSDLVLWLEGTVSHFVLLAHAIEDPRGGFAVVPPKRDPISDAMRKVRLAIAARVLESGGGEVELGTVEVPGFTIRMPRAADPRGVSA